MLFSCRDNNDYSIDFSDKIVQQIVSDEIIPSEEVVQVQVEAPSPEGHDGVTSTSANVSFLFTNFGLFLNILILALSGISWQAEIEA